MVAAAAEEEDDVSNNNTNKKKIHLSSYWLTNFPRDLMAGAMMGGMVHTVVAPIERTKLLLQTQESNFAILAGKHKRFNGMIDCILTTVKEEGLLSLWRGNGSSVLRYYPSVALNFSLKVYTFFVIKFLFFCMYIVFLDMGLCSFSLKLCSFVSALLSWIWVCAKNVIFVSYLG